jgi:hypothetical protein
MPKMFKNAREDKEQLDESQVRLQSSRTGSSFPPLRQKKVAAKKWRQPKQKKQASSCRINEALI